MEMILNLPDLLELPDPAIAADRLPAVAEQVANGPGAVT